MKDKHRQSFKKNTHFIQALKHAVEGFYYALKYERNIKIQLAIALLALILSVIFSLHWLEWLLVILAIAFMFVAELMNTAIELIIDLIVGQHYHDLARQAKDIGAAVALVAALFAFIVGVVIFLPKILLI